MSRRDDVIVAWHEVPGTTPPQKSCPVGYGVIRAGVRPFWISCARSYRTLRDGSFDGRFPRHFVPGYDRVVPTGRAFRHFATGFSYSTCTRPPPAAKWIHVESIAGVWRAPR